jgi:1,4-alpha-glucan branching enzyme
MPCSSEPAAASPSLRNGPGELAIVLHAHMPYVEGGGPWPHPDNPPHSRSWKGFGTWPFGEEWLWEAVATSYVPLLRVLSHGVLTLSLTPVLCDQLEAPGATRRCVEFLRQTRAATHALDIAAARCAGDSPAVAELERFAHAYEAAAAELEALGPGGLLAALGAHASWTSAATHPILPLLATDAGIALQLATGIESHRRRFGSWSGGFWLPECAYAPWLDEQLEAAGVRHTCVELTNLLGLGVEEHLRPLRAPAGPLLWPLDRELIDLVWAHHGYPAHAAYRNRHEFTGYHHVRANDGAAYDHVRALEQVRADATDFVHHAIRRLADGGVCVCAFDAELFGHWWYEGVRWLAEVIDAASALGLRLTTLDDGPGSRHPAALAPARLGISSWGEGRDLRTWSGPRAAELAWEARSAELELLAAGSHVSPRALRELLALQSSDWAFLHSRATAGEYPRERATGHRAELRRVLALSSRGHRVTPHLRNLAPVLAGWEG